MKRYIFILLVISFSLPLQSQILYLDNWKDIDGIKKITVTHYTALESLGEIDIDNQLLKIIGYFNDDGSIKEEKIFYSDYNDQKVYHIFYDEVTGKVSKILHEYGELINDKDGFQKKVIFQYNQRGDVEIAETWCNIYDYSCSRISIGKHYVLKSKKTEYNDDNWLLTSRYNYSYDEKGRLLGGSYKAKHGRSSTISLPTDHPDVYFNIFEQLKTELFEFRGSDPQNQLLNYSLDPSRYGRSNREETEIQLFKPIDSERRLPAPFKYYSFKRSYKYEYNEKGNWIKCVVFDGEKPIRIIMRNIEY